MKLYPRLTRFNHSITLDWVLWQYGKKYSFTGLGQAVDFYLRRR